MAQMPALSAHMKKLNPPETFAVPKPDFSEGSPFSVTGKKLIDLSRYPQSGGEALTGLGSGNQIAHVEGYGGSVNGSAGIGYAVTLGRQQDGLNNLEAVFFPNDSVRPRTLIATKVQTLSLFRAAQMFGPVQQAVADAVMAALKASYFGNPEKAELDGMRLVILPFVHPNAGQKKDGDGDDAKWVNLDGDELARANFELYWNNYWATLAVLHEIVTGGATTAETIEAWEKRGDHPFLGFKFAAE